MRGAPFLNLVLAVALTLMVGWLLVEGRGLFLPVFVAVIFVYVLTEAADWLGDLPVLNRLPIIVRHVILLAIFTLVVVSFGIVVTMTLDDLAASAPRYQANLEALSARLSAEFGLDLPPTWDDIWDATIGKVNFQALILILVSWVASFGLVTFLILVYAGFIIAERGSFAGKLEMALPLRQDAAEIARIIAEINTRIGRYLAVKTLINVILGTICYVIMWAMDVDFALFWAVVIALSNYIPYVGSIVGVAFPVMLSLAQFDSLQSTAVLGILLTAAQITVGNFIEPRMVGKQLNLSPLVVIVSLSVWATLWGIPGAILASPMTSMIAIILASFPSTRFIAVLLSQTGQPELSEETKAL